MADLDELALSLPQTTKDVSADGGRSTSSTASSSAATAAAGRTRSTRPRASGSTTCSCSASPTSDVKELLLADERGIYFTTPHFDGYAAVLVRIPDLARLERDELTTSSRKHG